MSIESNHISFKGEDVTFRMSVVDSAGAAQNVTGWTFAAQWRRTADSGTATLSYTSGTGIAINSATAGVVDVTIPDTDTDGIESGEFSYAVERSNAGSEAVLAHGRWTFLKDVVR